MAVIAIIGGCILVLFGGLYTVSLLASFGEPPGHVIVELLRLFTLGALPLCLGLGTIWYGQWSLQRQRRSAQVQRHEALERAILDAVYTHPQGVTAEECARQTALSVREVQVKLGTLYLDGTLEMEVAEEGCLVYKPKVV